MSTLALLLLSTLAVTSRNIVYSLVFLVAAYASATVLLVSVGLEFLGYSLLIVYVGAVAILFIFVIMTLDVRKDELAAVNVQGYGGYKSHAAIALLSLVLAQIPLSFLTKSEYLNRFYFVSSYTDLPSTKGVGAISSILYSTGSPYLVFSGMLLLVSMVGAILVVVKPWKP